MARGTVRLEGSVTGRLLKQARRRLHDLTSSFSLQPSSLTRVQGLAAAAIIFDLFLF